MTVRIKRATAFFASVLAIIMLICSINVNAFAAVDPNYIYPCETDSWENWPQGPELNGKTACLMEDSTATVLYGKGAMAAMYPASITKVMTAIIVLENVPDLSATVTMTAEGIADAFDGSSNIAPFEGEQFTVEQCLQMLLVKSANDVATQLAVYTAGSVSAFADLMNQKAADLGCQNTHFTNASGLEDENHYTCAYDMCLIMREALNYDKFREIIAMDAVTIPETAYSYARIYETHVYLMQPDSGYYYEGCLGGKTGYTEISGSTLVCAAERNGMTLVGVVMNAPETGANAEDMVNLFDYGFTNFANADMSLGSLMFASESTIKAAQAASMAASSASTSAASTSSTSTSAVSSSAISSSETSSDGTTEESSAAEVTTSDEQLDIESYTSKSSTGNVFKTFLYIILIVILAAVILILVIIQVSKNQANKKRRNRRR